MIDARQRAERWRLVLGSAAEESCGGCVSEESRSMDRALEALYDTERKGGLGPSAPSVPAWLGDIRKYFPSSVVQVMQRDALDRLDMRKLLLEPEMLESIVPDVRLVTTILSLRGALPARARETAREVVRRVVEELQRKLADPMRSSIRGALNRARRQRRPRHSDIDWDRTIRRNLKHWQPEHRTIVPETLIGHARRQASLRDVILCIDQSGSMAASVVYSSIFGAVLASTPSIATRLVVFDTNVLDLTDELSDPVELLFSTQLGGGTDINGALSYCQSLVRTPTDTVMVLISDLYEGGVREGLLRRAASLIGSGVQLVVLLALSDEGAPAFDHAIAAELAALGAPAFACTPDVFPDLMAAAIQRQDIARWASERGIVASRAP